jgi:hypothetical protein
MSSTISLIELQKRLSSIPPSELSSPSEIQRAVEQILHDMDKHAKEVEVKVKCQTKGDRLDCVTEVELKF